MTKDSSGILKLLIAAPILALFIGIGVLSYAISGTWTEATTASLITGMVAVCGGGAVVIALILSLIIGIPFAIRTFGEMGNARQAWPGSPAWGPMPPALPRAWQEDAPPMIGAKGEGRFLTQGPGTYDLWEGQGQDQESTRYEDWE